MPYLTYALNEKGELVGVDCVPTGAKCNCFCPGCKERLLAKNKGVKRAHHFAHRGVECKSAYESMLHLLAKEKIRDAFLSAPEFWIKFNYTSFCPNKKECKYITYSKCYHITSKQFNLKKYYDSCEQEVTYDNSRRRSDLKIFSSQNDNLPPIYLEFCVAHASDKEKLHSGNRIIEIKIESEDDILKICKEGFVETDYIGDNNSSLSGIKVDFYDFINKDYSNTSIENNIKFKRYILFESGKILSSSEICNCKSLKKSHRNSVLEICVHPSRTSFNEEEVGLFCYNKYGIKNCSICKNYVSSYRQDEHKICKMYRALNISKDNLDTGCAKACKYFQPKESKVNPEVEKSLIESGYVSIFE